MPEKRPIISTGYAACVLALLGAACGSSTSIDQQGQGRVEVVVATTGSSVDPNGYTVRVQSTAGTGTSTPQEFDANLNDDIVFTQVPAGPATVTLTDVSANCTVPDNPREITVPNQDIVNVRFDVSCS